MPLPWARVFPYLFVLSAWAPPGFLFPGGAFVFRTASGWAG
jgi:hypothetical protein